MSYAGYGQQQYRPEPKIRFDAIGEAWSFLSNKMGVWILATLAVVAIIYAVMGIFFAILAATMGGLNPQTINQGNFPVGLVLFLEFAFFIVMIAISGFMQAGFFRMAIKQVRGQDIAVSDIFKVGDVLLPSIGSLLAYGFAMGIGNLLCIIPGWIVMGRGMFAQALSADRGKGGIDAMQESWSATKSDTLNSILLMFVLCLMLFVGGFVIIGTLFTIPLFYLTIAVLYRDFFDTEGPFAPSLNMPLPPQSAYGPGNFNPPGMTPPPPMGQTPPPGQAPPQNPGQMGRIDM